MTPERWRQVEELYHQALERAPAERAAYLDQACAGDAALRQEVQSLLDQEGKLSGLLESPAMEVAAGILAEEEKQRASGALRSHAVAHYRVLDKIGSGGMGEVYRARDTKLNRDVALKFLPEILSRDPERMARFKREAQVLASLNHPNIATIYGFEESESVRALAMELVEGQTLAERLASKPVGAIHESPLQFDEALGIARQIAEALEAAHEKGIIHRDLKPANIKVTAEGMVKLLDFGLAKALDLGAGLAPPSGVHQAAPLQDSPTLTAAATEAGVILGTAAYMPPEQAKGKPVDRRADIWSFGCVLYEMLAGKRIFEGESVSDTLAAVLRAEPDWDALPATTPPRICEVVRRCLVKDPKQRLRDIGDARIAIEDTISGVGAIHELPLRAKAGEHRSPLQRTLPWAAGIFVGAILAGLLAWRFVISQAPAARPVVKFALALPAGDQLANLEAPALALSPDGSKLVYVAVHGNVTQLYLRSLNQLEAKPIAGTVGAACPFFSPDGQWIGFFADWKLKKISLKGGPPITISDNGAPLAYGASWGANDTIIFSPNLGGTLLQVSASGGTPHAVTTVNFRQGEHGHQWPQILPGGDFLFNVVTGENWDEARIEIFSPRTGERHALAESGARPHYVAAGAIIYERGGDLMAVPFDLKARKATGPAARVLEGVRMDSTSGGAQFSVSSEGSLAYIPGGTATPESTLVWVDRKGKEEPLPAPARQYLFLSLSPDDSRVAVQIGEPAGDIWVYDLVRQTLTRLTTDGGNRRIVWSPDGKRVAYGSTRDSQMNIYWANTDGSNEERLTTSEWTEFPTSFSPDGRLLAFHGNGLGILPLYGDRKAQSFLQTGFDPMFSPDGRWMAYCDGETGREEIYARPYPGPGEKLQVSNHGGLRPRWGQAGRELYYLEGNKVMRVAVTPGRELKLGSP